MKKDDPGSPLWMLTSALLGAVLLVAVPCQRRSGSDHDGPGGGTLGLESLRFLAAAASASDPSLASAPAPAFVLPGLDEDYVFVSGGQFVELSGGAARLSGVIASVAVPSRRFAVALDFTGEIAPGQEEHPPEDSPVKALADAAYSENGGPVETAEWRYYESVEGTLTGVLDHAGALFTLEREGPAVQVGRGANGRNGADGLSMWILATRTQQSTIGAILPEEIEGEVHLDFSLAASLCVQDVLGRALWLPGFGDELVFVDPGTFVEYEDGTAALSGIAASKNAPGEGWRVELTLSGRVDLAQPGYPPHGSPKTELPLSSYTENGGPVDTGTWRYYSETYGNLLGLGGFAGAVLQVAAWGPPLQVGFGANGLSHDHGTSVWLTGQLLEQPDGPETLPWFLNQGDLHVDLLDECDRCRLGGCAVCVRAAESDPEYGVYGAGHALWLPGVATDLVFVGGGSFVENMDGSARLTGVLASIEDPNNRWIADVVFIGLVEPGAPNHPPEGSPKKELHATAYVESGGSVDATPWRYYEQTTGSLVGLADNRGASIVIDRLGPAFQIGAGANGKNIHYGASGWVTFQVTSQPFSGPSLPTYVAQGDLNLDFGGDCSLCAVGVDTQAVYGEDFGRIAFWLKDIGGSFELDPVATFAELADGTALLTGVIALKAEPGKRFDVTLEFGERVDPGTLSHPPEGSPKQSFPDASLVSEGGLIDPGLWHYYRTMNGTLIGLDALAGAELRVARMGPAFQVGLGANTQNEAYGASGWFTVEVVSQPDEGPPFPAGADRGDVYVDVTNECP